MSFSHSLRALCLVGMTILFFLLLPSAVLAANFTTDYRVTYTPREDGTTDAALKITLTNTSSDKYASSYTMHLGFNEITNVRARDEGGPIEPVVEKTDDGYTVYLNFNKRAVGIESKQPFLVEFETPNIAKQYGNVWEITIPGIANPDEFNSFVVEVKPPASFGTLAYSKPQQPHNGLVFTKDQLGKSGISLAFDDKQRFAFDLSYHLQNKNPFPSKETIALPPSTNYQDVYLTAINPEPDNVTVDHDGNWLAHYSLLPSQKIDVAVAGKAEVFLNPKQEALPLEDKVTYLAEQPYWEVTDPEIKALAEELKTPEAIYTYVQQNLSYDFSRVTDNKDRLGAKGVLAQTDSAACREFTDLFIALARAAGIPAREVNGFAYSENPQQRPLSLVRDILHSWPEYYDAEKKTWVMVDPTWGSTTGGIDYFSLLDTDHFAFVIKGLSSTDPIPAGGYKLGGASEAQDIDIAFIEEIPERSLEVDITSTVPGKVMAGFPLRGEVMIRNVGTSYIPPQLVYISSDEFSPQDQVFTTAGIPPFGSAKVPLSFNAQPILSSKDASFTVRVGEEGSEFSERTYTHAVQVLPIHLNIWGIAGIILFLAVGFLLLILKLKRSK